ncbi:COesterase domain containing protein [Asbolus verrucosus]|uniref:COesterase domain containing protein n=1 Tax=Asbolus verrucosus TaxID=1661398 RepID=A0A482VIL4_ASBVE|nr:COesterase domain containing protein [Asbolus verrucosus]
MTYITKTLTIIITLCLCQRSLYTTANSYSFTNPYIREFTRNITLRQGSLQGIVVSSQFNRELPLVEQYKGIPYAAPPVGKLRFMPSNSAPSWFGTKFADEFGPVCPQKFPDTKTMTPERRDEFLKLHQFLQNQSEDCLYLNIYAPYQGKKYGRMNKAFLYNFSDSRILEVISWGLST